VWYFSPQAASGGVLDNQPSWSLTGMQSLFPRDHLVTARVTDGITGGDIVTSTSDAMTRAARGIFLGAAVGDALGWPVVGYL
jgi:hypothetical protein